MRDARDGLPFDLDELRTTQHPPHVHAQHREYRLPDYLFSNLWSGGPGCSAVPTRPPCETTTCDACRDQRVALCLTGSPRSFVRPHVYSAFKSHLIGGLDASTTDVFVVTRLEDADRKVQEVHNHSRQDATREQLVRALAPLRPRAVSLDSGNPSQRVYGVRYNERCSHNSSGFIGFSRDHIMRSVAQPASWTACMGMVEAAERMDRRRYDWVIKSRSDLFWYAAHPHVCSLTRGYIHTNMYDTWLDHHFVLPRRVALSIMRLADAYESCDGTFAYTTVEDWLRARMLNETRLNADDMPQCVELVNQTTRSKHRPYNVSSVAGVTTVGFPFVLLRNSSFEPDANRMARKSCMPYATLDGKSMEALCEEARKHGIDRDGAQRAFMRCMSDAYPEDRMPADFHGDTNRHWWNGFVSGWCRWRMEPGWAVPQGL